MYSPLNTKVCQQAKVRARRNYCAVSEPENRRLWLLPQAVLRYHALENYRHNGRRLNQNPYGIFFYTTHSDDAAVFAHQGRPPQ
jgi:hypothetical protein